MEASGLGITVPKAAELIATELRRQIVRGELLEGDALPSESGLTAVFGVSRPTLREAFRVLESEGLIDVHRGSRGGARVRVPTDGDVARYAGLVLEHRRATIVDVSAVRAILEPPCAAAIVRRRDTRAITILRGAIEVAEAISDPVEQLEAQHRFHTLLVDLGGNRTIGLLHGAVQAILDRAGIFVATVKPDEAEQARRLGGLAHRRLLEHLEAGDGAEAEAFWRNHIVETTSYLIRSGGSTAILDLL